MSKTKDKIREYEHGGKHFVDVDLTVTLSLFDYGIFERVWDTDAVDYMERKAAAALMNDADNWAKVLQVSDTTDDIDGFLNDVYHDIYIRACGRA